MTHATEIAQVLLASFVATGFAMRVLVPSVAATGLVLLVIGQAGLLLTILPESLQRPPLLAIGAVTALAGTLLAARLADGRHDLLVVAVAAALPLRIPVEVSGERFNLLLPLYAVLAVCTVRLLLDLRGTRVTGARRHVGERPSGQRALEIGLAAVVAISALSVAWSIDTQASAERVALVYAPFALLYVILRQWVTPRALQLSAWAFSAVMAVAALAGLYQRATQTIWQNAKVGVANTFAPNFRTNSIFWDPNIYGRYLVAALLGVFVALLVARSGRQRWQTALAVGAALLFGGGLWYSYSQSSFVALAAAAVVLALVLLPVAARWLLVALLAVSLLGAPLLASELRGRDAETRGEIAARGLSLAAERPIVGVGVAAFEKGIRKLSEDRGAELPRQRSSHTTPVTLLAETGVIGTAAWLLVLTAAGALTIMRTAGARRIALGYEAGPSPAVRWWAGATIAAVTAHSMFYAGFFEDPLVWAAAAVLAGAAAHELRVAAAPSGGSRETVVPGRTPGGDRVLRGH